ncbi:hypothetical protein BDF19DRAFT_497777, partial [Syncephalis fuscata]
MLFSKYQQLVLLLFTCILIQINYVCAKLTLFNGTSDQISYKLTDAFLYPEPHRRPYNGTALVSNFLNYTESNTKCSFPLVNASDPMIQNIAEIASSYPDFALIVKFKYLFSAKCDTTEQISQAIDKLMRQLLRAGFPPVKLFILLSYTPPYFYLGYDYIIGNSYDVKILLPVLKPITIAIMEASIFPKDMKNVNGYTAFHYTAGQEPNPWNEIFFSHTYIVYKWTYFAIVLGVLLYACTRTIMLARFKLLKRNLLLIAFVISIIYCIFFLIHLTAL